MAKSSATATKSSGKKEYDNSNSGALFVNNKEGNEKRPDYTGKLSVRVEDYTVDSDGNATIFLAAWERDSDRVGKYLSIKAQPPQDK